MKSKPSFNAASKLNAPSGENTQRFQESLLAWFKDAERDFPWRHNATAYQVLIAEKLLQQSLARPILVNIYLEFLQRYPTPKSLSEAEVSDLVSLIKPLGFTYRAKELKEMGLALEERHSGHIPDNLKDLLALPGIGDYAARAVLSFAHRQDVPIVDTNVARFLYRIYAISGPLPANPARKKSLIGLAANLVPKGRAKQFNLAVLDLCALICRPAIPKCSECPVRLHCRYGSGNAAMPPGDLQSVQYSQPAPAERLEGNSTL